MVLILMRIIVIFVMNREMNREMNRVMNREMTRVDRMIVCWNMLMMK